MCTRLVTNALKSYGLVHIFEPENSCSRFKNPNYYILWRLLCQNLESLIALAASDQFSYSSYIYSYSTCYILPGHGPKCYKHSETPKADP